MICTNDESRAGEIQITGSGVFYDQFTLSYRIRNTCSGDVCDAINSSNNTPNVIRLLCVNELKQVSILMHSTYNYILHDVYMYVCVFIKYIYKFIDLLNYCLNVHTAHIASCNEWHKIDKSDVHSNAIRLLKTKTWIHYYR